ncbi:MAG: serine--tRNA ligase, partial [Candidatus Parcubacteria bacterium]|nr:serine--tRNA ligase [Candidatus Parcubacteria bacterium]
MDLKFIRQNKQLIIDGCRKKRVKVDIDKIITLDEGRRELMGRTENLRAEQNKMGKKPSPEEINHLKQIKTDLKAVEEELKKIELELMHLVHLVPNMPLPEVIEGQSEADNVVLREVGQKPKFSFTPKDYLVLNEKLDLIDTERAAKVASSRFGYFKNEAVLLEFGLIQLALEFLIKNNFTPVIPPVMVNRKAMAAMGYLDRGGDEIYHFAEDDLYLV